MILQELFFSIHIENLMYWISRGKPFDYSLQRIASVLLSSVDSIVKVVFNYKGSI